MFRRLSVVLFAAAALAAPLRAETLASVGPEKITREEFDAAALQEAAARKHELSAQERGELLRSMVNQRLLVVEARRRKLDRDPAVKAALEETERRLLAEKLYQDEVGSKAAVSMDQAREFYGQNPALFDVAEVSQIVITPKGPDDKAAQKRAEELARTLAKSPKGFAAAAKKESDDKLSRDRGGDLGTLRRGMLLPELEQAVFNAKPGSVVGPVATRFGLHILHVRKISRLSWDQAGASLRNELQDLRARQLQQGLIDGLGKKLKIKISEDKL
jgi:parvulin-like peptidyl-prolyl isomerase